MSVAEKKKLGCVHCASGYQGRICMKECESPLKAMVRTGLCLI